MASSVGLQHAVFGSNVVSLPLMSWILFYGLATGLILVVVCLLAASQVQLSVCAGSGWPHNMRCGTIGSCQSAASSFTISTQFGIGCTR